MNKKAQRVVVSILLLILVLVIISYVFFINPQGPLRQIAEKSLSFSEKVLGIKKERQPTSVEVPPPVVEMIYNSLLSAFEEGKASPDERCLISHYPFPETHDSLSSYRIEIADIGDKLLDLRIVNKDGMVLTFEHIEGLSPCVIGKSDAAINFYYNWFESKKGGPELKLPEFSEIRNQIAIIEATRWTGVRFFYDGKPFFANWDRGLLYKADKEHICFFPTTKTYTGEYLDNDLMADVERIASKCKVGGYCKLIKDCNYYTTGEDCLEDPCSVEGCFVIYDNQDNFQSCSSCSLIKGDCSVFKNKDDCETTCMAFPCQWDENKCVSIKEVM